MLAKVNGDYSKFPDKIQSTLPVIEGELCQFFHYWSTFSRLFMSDKTYTEKFDTRLGGILGELKLLMTEKLFFILSRLTDKDGKLFKNVSMWRLIESTDDSELNKLISTQIEAIYKSAENIRTVRNKEFGHNSLELHEGKAILPFVSYEQLKLVADKLSELLNLLHEKYEDSYTEFDPHSGVDVTEAAEETIQKANALEYYERIGTVPRNGWRLIPWMP